MKLDTSTWGLIIALGGAGIVLSSDYVHSVIPIFIGMLVAWFGINMIIRGRMQEHGDD